MTDPAKLTSRLALILVVLIALLISLLYLPENNRPTQPQVIFPVIVLSGLLAGLVNFYILFVKVKLQPQPEAALAGEVQQLNENPWMVLLGYFVIGVAGAFLIPVLNVILTGLPGLEFLKPTLAQKSLLVVGDEAFQNFVRTSQAKLDSLADADSTLQPALTKLRAVVDTTGLLPATQATPLAVIPARIGVGDYAVLVGYCVVAGVYADTILKFIALRLAPAKPNGDASRSDTPTHTDKSDQVNNDESNGLESATAEQAPGLPHDFSNLTHLPVPLAEGFVKGIDISHHNQIVSWTAVKNAGIEFVYIKMTDGVSTPDQVADRHARAAKAQGLKVGYYHFCRPDKKIGGTLATDAAAEADEVVDTLRHLPPADLPLMIDLEDQGPRWDTPLNPADYLTWITLFLSKTTPGTNPSAAPIIYSRSEYLDRKLPARHGLTNRLWLSRYNPDFRLAVSARGWTNWTLWQFTEAGMISPNGLLDLNLWRKDDYNQTLAAMT